VNRALFAITLAVFAATACAGGKHVGDPAEYPVYSSFPSARFLLPGRASTSPASDREGDGPGLSDDRSSQ
jgi:hypothetical protein